MGSDSCRQQGALVRRSRVALSSRARAGRQTPDAREAFLSGRMGTKSVSESLTRLRTAVSESRRFSELRVCQPHRHCPAAQQAGGLCLSAPAGAARGRSTGQPCPAAAKVQLKQPARLGPARTLNPAGIAAVQRSESGREVALRDSGEAEAWTAIARPQSRARTCASESESVRLGRSLARVCASDSDEIEQT